MTGLRERLVAAELASVAFRAADGHMSIGMRSNEGAADAALGVLGDQETHDLIADVVTQWQVGDGLHAQWIDAAEAHKIAAAVVAALTKEQT